MSAPRALMIAAAAMALAGRGTALWPSRPTRTRYSGQPFGDGFDSARIERALDKRARKGVARATAARLAEWKAARRRARGAK